MQNYQQTIISQYSNSPTINQLIENMNEYLDPRVNLLAFYDYIWNVDTAVGFGLDILGRIVGVIRNIPVPGTTEYFGFQDGGFGDYTPFNGGPFFERSMKNIGGSVYTLGDDAFRVLVLVKAFANISACDAHSINRLLMILFAGRGRAYVLDPGGMQINYVFEFALQPYELAILNSGMLLKPAGVKINIVIVPPTVFEFLESGSGTPFGEGVFYAG